MTKMDALYSLDLSSLEFSYEEKEARKEKDRLSNEQQAIARHRHTPVSKLDELMLSDDIRVLKALSKNINLPISHTVFLGTHKDKTVRKSIASRKRTEPWVLQLMAENEAKNESSYARVEVEVAIASNPSTSLDTLVYLWDRVAYRPKDETASSVDVDIIRAIAAREDFPYSKMQENFDSIFNKEFKHSHFILLELAKHKETSNARLTKIVNLYNRSSEISFAAAHNLNLEIRIVIQEAEDYNWSCQEAMKTRRDEVDAYVKTLGAEFEGIPSSWLPRVMGWPWLEQDV